MTRRWTTGVHHWIFLAALAVVAGRIAVVRSADGGTAMLSANDRSRWATVASLVEHGTYRIDRLVARVDPVHRNRRPFDSIDKVMHVGTDGKFHAYSSKPPLLATMVAAVYWPIHAATGLTITRYPGYVPRLILAIVNLPTLAILFYATFASIRPRLTDLWTRTYAAIAVAFGTMLTPMAVSLNNHLPAAAATAVVLAIFLSRTWTPVRLFVAATAAALAVACELPSLAMLCLWSVMFALVAAGWIGQHDDASEPPRVARVLGTLAVVTGLVLVAAAFFGTNYIAHRSLRMPYAHRGNGAIIQTVDSLDEIDTNDWRMVPSDEPGRRRLWSTAGRPSRAVIATDNGFEIRQWDDWYEYPGSYWQDGNRRGVDRGEPNRLRYAMHMLIGHHGVLSITPIWILSVAGTMLGLFRAGLRRLRIDRHDAVILATAAVTTVCIAFYIARPEIDRNYGGVSSCFRWLLWLTPLWFHTAATTLRKFEHSASFRYLAAALLAPSVFSAAIALDNPWQSPWIERWLTFLGYAI